MNDSCNCRVSVIVPNYSHARFLRERLDSIYGQTFRDFEVILLDDASTDGSVDVLREYAGRPDTRMVVNERNSGCVFRQWNKGIGLARGEYVWIAESDDRADETLLERLVAALDAHTGVGLAYCDSRLIDQDGNVRGRTRDWFEPFRPGKWDSDYVADGNRERAECLVICCTIPNASAVVFRRRVYMDAHAGNTRFRQTGDYYTWSRMLERSDVAYVAETLNAFRHHATSVSGRGLKSLRAVAEVCRVRGEILRSLHVDEKTRHMVRERLLLEWCRAVSDPGARVCSRAGVQAVSALIRLDPTLLPRLLKFYFWTRERNGGVEQHLLSGYRAVCRRLGGGRHGK